MKKICETATGLLVYLMDSDGSDFVMPAKAGIQENEAFACGYVSWIPGLVLLARNDATIATPQIPRDEVLLALVIWLSGL
jgi:hypothetical protein